jgi:periplasmic protein CpxP/Spy
MLKDCSLAVILAGLVCIATASAVAQNNGTNDQQSAPAGEPSEHGYGHRHFDPAKRTEMLTKQLTLTSDQQPKVLEILKSEQSQMEKLRSDSSVTQDDRRSKMTEIHKASNDQIRALLDSNQQRKWDAMQSRREQWQGRQQDGQAAGAAPDSDQK